MDNSELPVISILQNFSPRLRDNIKELLTDVDFGMLSLNVKVNANVSKTSHHDYTDTYLDSFILEIPFAGKHLEWEVIFKEEDYGYAPDFDFINDVFLYDPDVNVILDHVPSLANWNVENRKCLISVIKELLKLYKQYQIMKLQAENRYSRLAEEYDTLLRTVDIPDDNIQLYIENNGSVHFVIGIIVDFSCLPPYIQPVSNRKGTELLNPRADLATLKLSFTKPDCTKVQSSLYLTPHLEQTLGNATKLRIPTYNKDTTLLNYVSNIKGLLKDRVEQIARHHKMKNEFISVLVAQCGTSMIEYDTMLFSKATLLFHVNNIYVIVSICLGDKFPEEKPKVTLHSIYNLQNDKPFCEPVGPYPYSPRWKPEEMIARLLNHLQENLPKFQATAQHNFSN